MPIAPQAAWLTSDVVPPFVHTPKASQAACVVADVTVQAPIARHAASLAAEESEQDPTGTLSDTLTRLVVTTSTSDTIPAGAAALPVETTLTLFVPVSWSQSKVGGSSSWMVMLTSHVAVLPAASCSVKVTVWGVPPNSVTGN